MSNGFCGQIALAGWFFGLTVVTFECGCQALTVNPNWYGRTVKAKDPGGWGSPKVLQGEDASCVRQGCSGNFF
jgi:hypothetical protein